MRICSPASLCLLVPLSKQGRPRARRTPGTGSGLTSKSQQPGAVDVRQVNRRTLIKSIAALPTSPPSGNEDQHRDYGHHDANSRHDDKEMPETNVVHAAKVLRLPYAWVASEACQVRYQPSALASALCARRRLAL